MSDAPEVRLNDDGTLDEIVAGAANVHLEQMSDKTWWLAVEQGGNPLAQAHITACARAGITGFRVHDWRHDYATRFLSAGGDVRSLMQIMGWSSPRMVQRYVTYRDDQIAAIVARVA